MCVWNVRSKPKTREQTQNSETKNRGAGVKRRGVCGMFETNPKLENEPKTPKEKIVGRALRIVMCVCGMFEENPKLDNKSKTPKQKIMRRVFSNVVCVWNVRNEPKTREQTQNSETKNRGAGVKHRGVYVECSKPTQNSRTNPKLGNKES